MVKLTNFRSKYDDVLQRRCFDWMLLLMRGDLPSIAPSVHDHCPAIPIWHVRWFFQRSCASVKGSPICFVGVGHIYIEEGRHWLPDSCFTDHDHRVANFYYRWHVLSIITCCSKHTLDELDQALRLANHNSWRDSTPALRRELVMVGWSFHNIVPCSATVTRLRKRVKLQSPNIPHVTA